MRAVFKAVALVGLVAGLVASLGVTSAPGLQKDKDKTKTNGEGGTVEVYQAKDGWRFRVKDAEGKTIAVGVMGYEKKEDVIKAVESLKSVMGKFKAIDLKDDTKDEKKDPKKDTKPKEKPKDGKKD